MRYNLSLILTLCLSFAASAQSLEQCMDFLYKYMPQPDKADYSRAFYEENVKTTLAAREQMSWGKSVPEREFLHFVLPVRVNNENMDRSRMVFFDELKGRVKGLSMEQAILEVNHWCHEKVTYTPSDERTSCPLASIRTAYGRCGEESTFLVAALRSVCIPARQVYTPRWAHTDDNHAWVEAWADGKWHFLGACEPEPVLDLGWFNAPASRGMLMHTKAFGDYRGPEEVMQRTQCFTEIDVTANYAPVARREVLVVDSKGKPVANATVEFKIYNYAEFYTVSRKTTDAQGKTYMQAGKGDLLAWACKDNKYGFAVCGMAHDGVCKVVLNHVVGEAFGCDIKIVPPVERNNLPPVTDEQRSINNIRMAQEDSIRNAYVATFPATENVFIKKSRGNYEVITQFLSRTGMPFEPETLLSVISDKDLRDIPVEVLNDVAANVKPNKGYPEEIYNKYVLNPRVAAENLTTYRDFLLKNMSRDDIRRFASVEQIVAWTRQYITIDEKSNPQRLRMTPIGVFTSRTCDARSRNIFFVALCRTMGHAARINEVTDKVEYYAGGQWLEVNFESQAAPAVVAKGKYMASYEPDAYVLDPKYYINFSISRLDNGAPVLLNYAEEDTWGSTLKDGVELEEGTYLLVTGTRMADGSVIAHLECVPVKANATAEVKMAMPQSDEGLKVIGNFNSENLYADAKLGTKSLLSSTGRGYYVLGLIAPNNEPTNHALRDIAAVKAELDALGVPFVLLFKDKDEMGRFDVNEFPALPVKTFLGTDIYDKMWNEISTGMHLQASTKPVFIIADTFNRIVFISQGYTIGLGDQLLKNLKKL